MNKELKAAKKKKKKKGDCTEGGQLGRSGPDRRGLGAWRRASQTRERVAPAPRQEGM